MPADSTFESELKMAVDLIDLQPENIKRKALVVSARAALETLLEDIGDNPGAFKGSTGRPNP